MRTKKILSFILIAAGIALGLFLLPFILKIFAPFIAAFAVSAVCQKFVRFLSKKFHISRGISSALISVTMVALATLLVVFISFQLYSQSKNLVSALPAAVDSFRGQLNRITMRFDGYRHNLPDEISHFLDNAALNVKEYSSELSHKATTAAFDFAKSFAARLPKMLLSVSMFVLSTFFFTKDFDLIIKFFKEILPKKAILILKKVSSVITHAFSCYLKAQLILMLLTSGLVAISLWITDKENPLLWGIICGLVDALPFFGTAIILVPWALFYLVYGDIPSFLTILIIQILVFLVRQLAEPKVVSHQIGIHPILTLVGVYIGLRYFGILGVVFAPIIMLLFANLYMSYKENS